MDVNVASNRGWANAGSNWGKRLAEVNRELWLVLSLFVIAGLLNWVVSSHGMILGFYTLPTIFSAYVYGRRHAVLTAVASILLVVTIAVTNPGLMTRAGAVEEGISRWSDLAVWAGLLIITAYAMGTLYERKESHVAELRKTYFGVLTILQQFVLKDEHVHNHAFRVAIYAANIARRMGFDDQRIDDVRAAALLHDLAKLDTSREILCKAASQSPEEMVEVRKHVQKGMHMLEPVGSSLQRILPIILSHQEPYDGASSSPRQAGERPIEARVLAVAEAFDTLTTDRPYRRAVTPFEAREIIVQGSGKDFDPAVVGAFVECFNARAMEIPDGMVV